MAKWSETDSFFCEGKSTPQFTNIPSFPVVLTFLKFLSGCCRLLGLWCHTSGVKKSNENFQLQVDNEMEMKIIEWKQLTEALTHPDSGGSTKEYFTIQLYFTIASPQSRGVTSLVLVWIRYPLPWIDLGLDSVRLACQHALLWASGYSFCVTVVINSFIEA